MSWVRETQLLRLIETLWNEYTPAEQAEWLERVPELRWALPVWEPDHGVDDWVTTEQVAQAFFLSPNTVRNWPGREGIRAVENKWRWGDVLLVRLRQKLRAA